MKKLILAFFVLVSGITGAQAQYCTAGSTNTGATFEKISNVTFSNVNNNSTASAGYENFTGITANVNAGTSYPLSVSISNADASDQILVWIDFNGDQDFVDAGELVYTSPVYVAGNPPTFNTNVLIPTTATGGVTRMRIRLQWTSGVQNNTPCGTTTFGQVEDYSVNINTTPCAGTPAPGNTVSSQTTPLCAGQSTTLSAQNATSGIGVTYQWQSSATGAPGSFTNIGSATSATYTVTPTATAYYQVVVTCATGPASGTSTPVQIVVNPLPTVTIAQSATCGSPTTTLTASGADTYTWTPTTGLTPAAGNTPQVIANPNATTTYTVTGTLTATGCRNTASATVITAPTASVITAASALQLNENFEAVPAGWLVTNNSTSPGNPWSVTTAATLAPPPAGTGYAVTNFSATSSTLATGATISNWLITPAVSIKNGDQLTFWSRTGAGALYADRLEVRMSTAGTSSNVGTTTTSVGDFTTVLVTINPTLVSGTANYPDTWTKYTATISGVTGTVTGRFGFRYFVTDGGTNGSNSNIIGLDLVQFGTPGVPVCAGTVSNLNVAITGGVGPYRLVYSDGTTNYTFNNYTSGAPINVTPSVSTNYTIVSVTGSNGCVGSGNSGTANITITPASAITAQPAATTNICAGGNATITVGTNTPTTANTFQYQVSTDGGATFTNITNGGIYSGATTSTLTITGATAAQQGYVYRVNVNGACGPTGGLTSTGSTLSVNTPAVITAPTVAGNFNACAGTANATTLSVTATGNALTYQWQVSTNGGTTFTNVTNGANYAGATTSTLSILNAPSTFAGNQYRVLVSSGGCTGTISPVQTLVNVNTAPVVTISASPSTANAPGAQVTYTAAVSSATAPITYRWYVNGVLIPGATGQTFTPDPNLSGSVTVIAKDANSCSSAFASSTPVSLPLSGAPSGTIFIYPSPNNGSFQVRYYNATATANINEAARLNVYDDKGSRIYTQRYVVNGPYTPMNVNLGTHSRGMYRVEVADDNGNRLKTGSVFVF